MRPRSGGRSGGRARARLHDPERELRRETSHNNTTTARAGGNTGDSGVTTPLEPVSPPVGGSSSVARRAVRRAAVDMSTATTTAACTRARAARALYTLQQGPRSTKRAPSTAIELQGVGAGLAQLATSRVTGPVLAASSTSEMHCRSQWSRSGLSECIHVAVDGHHLMPV